jgi:hypothetical protein
MKTFAAALAACFVGLLMTATLAHAGDPIPGKDVGLEHDPQGIVARGVTDEKGNVTFTKLKAGQYAVVLLDSSKLPAFVFRITNVRANAVGQVSEPVLPGKNPGPAYAMDKSGRKLMVDVDKDGQVTVRVESAK